MNSYLDMDEDFDSFNRKFNSRRNTHRKSRRRKRKPLYKRDKITMYEYLANSVPADASFVINKYGRFEKPRNEKDLAKQLKSFVKMFGEKAINELASIHPDRKLLESNCGKCKVSKEIIPIPKPNYQEFSNAEGNAELKEANKHRLTTNMLVIGGFMVMAFALIQKNK
tara:strand:- start:30186 stop:30689 length:504 start_codon:yes stop_codon:yes gene_type:complete